MVHNDIMALVIRQSQHELLQTVVDVTDKVSDVSNSRALSSLLPDVESSEITAVFATIDQGVLVLCVFVTANGVHAANIALRCRQRR